MYNKKFKHLAAKRTAAREKELRIAKIEQDRFYRGLIKELQISNRQDCSKDSDKCRRKCAYYMACKQRQ